MEGFLVLISCVVAMLYSAAGKSTDLLVITVASEQTDAFSRYTRSANRFGLNVKVLPLKDTRGSFSTNADVKRNAGGHKVNLLRKELEIHQGNNSLVIMFIDCCDAVFVEGADLILSRFAKLGARVVFSGDTHCWPDHSLEAKYPAVKPSRSRFLNSGAFMGYASDLYQMVSHSPIQDGDDDQAYYTGIFLNPSFRDTWKIKLDRKAEIFQNFYGAQEDVIVKYRGNHSFLYNKRTGTTPLVFHLKKPTTTNKMETAPSMVMYVLFTGDVPFIREFLDLLAGLDYPKGRIDLFIRNKKEKYDEAVNKFLEMHEREYNSVTHVPPSRTWMSDVEAFDSAIGECMDNNCQYFFYVDCSAHLTDPGVLKSLIKLKKTIVSPMLICPPLQAITNFIPKDGRYPKPGKRLAEVKCIKTAFLVKGSALPKLRDYHRIYDTDPERRNVPQLDVEDPVAESPTAFCQRAHQQGITMYVTNERTHGDMIRIYRDRPELADLSNTFNFQAWKRRYMHKDVDRPGSRIQVCPGVYAFPLLNDTFCKEFLDMAMEKAKKVGVWNDTGGENDPQNARPQRYVGLQTLNYVGQWRQVMWEQVHGVQRSLFCGYIPDPTGHGYLEKLEPTGEDLPHLVAMSAYTMSIGLSAPGVDYEGGGRYFKDLNCTAEPHEKGWVLIHAGGIRFQDLRITKGVRYSIITGD